MKEALKALIWLRKKESGGIDWLVAGLGNPGAAYAQTRHNIGFWAADAIAAQTGVSITRLKHRALTARCSFGGASILLLKPQTYMNLSGHAVREAAAYYKIPPERVLVIFDDISLPMGRLRIRGSGSSGGHKGVQSIISCLGTETFPRIKIGVGAPPRPEMDAADWVLAALTPNERRILTESAALAAEAAKALIQSGISAAMNQYNRFEKD